MSDMESRSSCGTSVYNIWDNSISGRDYSRPGMDFQRSYVYQAANLSDLIQARPSLTLERETMTTRVFLSSAWSLAHSLPRPRFGITPISKFQDSSTTWPVGGGLDGLNEKYPLLFQFQNSHFRTVMEQITDIIFFNVRNVVGSIGPLNIENLNDVSSLNLTGDTWNLRLVRDTPTRLNMFVEWF
jgi:hypothetical protein